MSVPQTTREYRLPKLDGFQNLTLQESPIPKLKPTEVLVRVHAVSLLFRDLIIALGQYMMELKPNVVPGSDMAGSIIALGEDVQGWAVGDRVCSNMSTEFIFGDVTQEAKNSALGGPIDGVLTEYKVLPAHALVRIPEHLSYEEASTLPCAAVTAYNALLGGKPLKAGDTVLIQGTGGVSIFGLQFAVASGASVIVTSSSDKKLEVAKKLGAAHVINYKTTPDWDKEVLKITGGRGVDHVVEVGGPATIMQSMNAVRLGGSVHVIGFVGGISGGEALPLTILGQGANLRGVLVGSRTHFEDMNRLITATKLKPVVDKVFDFEHLQEAYKYQASQQHVGKVVVKVSKN